MMILSTKGSKTRPSLVTRPYLRAYQPSIQSVLAAITNTTTAATYIFSGMRIKTTTDSTSRRAVSWLGRLKGDGLAAELTALIVPKLVRKRGGSNYCLGFGR